MPQLDNLREIVRRKAQVRIAIVLLVSYAAISIVTLRFVPASAALYPATAFALSALYFGGTRLWPFVYVTALIAAFFGGAGNAFLITFPLGVTLQAVCGAYLLRATHVDTLFRRYKDMFYLIATMLVISLITPTIEALSRTIRDIPYSLVTWQHAYVASIFSVIIISPFLLRWLTKISFKRTAAETYETLAVFTVLIVINYELFTRGVSTVLGIPLLYALLVPLFWIALRLRPRFVTLALLLTSLSAVTSVIADTPLLNERLFNTELFLIVLATVFYIIVSLEEDRRVNTNIMHSQVGMLQNAVARISSESDAKNNFIAILAHEIRNPLAPIASGIETLKLKGTRDAEDAATLDIMSDRMSTVRRLLDDLLEISRISEGKVAIKSETVDLVAALKRSIVSTQHHRLEMHQSLSYTPPHQPIYIAGDSVRIEQIFSNLLTNASKYSHSGDKITLVVRKQDRTVVVEVIDNGIGLDADSLDAIFIPFRQVKDGKLSHRGLGIGLALVRNFVELHRGSVTAESKGLGFGSRFTVRLPILFTPVHAETVSSPATEVTPPSKTSPLHVLIVDDNDAAAASMGRLLELKGCSVDYAYTGNQAVEKALDTTPDVVLLDVGLPDIDGYEVAKTLRAQGFEGRLIALTGYSTVEAREKGKEAGFDHYVVKPAGLAELRAALPELT